MALQVRPPARTAMRKPKAPEANRAADPRGRDRRVRRARLQGREHGRDRGAHAARRAR